MILYEIFFYNKPCYNEQAETILAHFSNEIDIWFIDPFTHPLWKYKLRLWMGSHIKVTKRALRIMINSKYNSHNEPLFKRLHLLRVNDIFDVQCLKFCYEFVNKKFPKYFRDMFKYNYELHEIGPRSHDQLHLYPTRTNGARDVLRHHIPELLNKFPKYLMDRIKTHSLFSIFYNIKCYLIDLYSYNCGIIDCNICNNNNREWQLV